jgi:murein peptide amidase A
VSHRAHDYRHLTQRWRAVARTGGLMLRTFARTTEHDILHLATPALRETGGIYISAGIHGDEPGSSEGLIAWAERHVHELARLPLILFPCLNPWGLVQNSRLNEDGIDLNRVFHTNKAPVVAALKSLIRRYRFDLALMLHEDYDGQGFYLYEVQREMPFWGEALLRAVPKIMPIDPRSRIDRRISQGGLIRRRFERARFQRMGYPEAIHLHLHHSRRTFTLETPSEFALAQRVEVQIAIIEEGVRKVTRGSRAVGART